MSSVQLAGVADALAAVAEGTAMVVAGEVTQVLGIASACDLHRVDENVIVAGAERWVPGGADGTPDIGEFVAAELGLALGVSPASATCVDAGIDQTACGVVDRHCVVALALQPWSRVRGRIEGWILLADPAAAAEREAKAALARRVEVGAVKAGHCDLWGRLDAADGIALDHALTSIAKTLPTDHDLDVRRAAAVGVLARQALGQAELPRAAEVIVHLDATPTADGADLADAAQVQGWGAVLTDRLGHVLAGCQVTVRPLLDARSMAPTDAYELPASMRRVLEGRWPADAFPHGSRASASCQADHTAAFDHDAPAGHGQTHPDLMAPLSPFAHRVKTHGGWGCAQPEPGLLVWTTPHGWQVVTTPAGTIVIQRPEPREHAWWHQEPPDWLDDPPEEVDGPDPGPAQPPLALAYAFTA